MKLLLLHGPAISISRKKLVDIRSKFDQNNVISFSSNANSNDVLNAIQTPSLLAQEQLIVWENAPDDFVFNSTFYILHSTFILWFDHELKANSEILKWVKESGGEILTFAESREVSVFPFLDMLAAKDKKAFLEMQKLKEAGFDIFYFITMVFYLLRNLVVTPKNAPPFVKQKLERQRKNFTSKQIKNLYRQVIELDFKLKSGLLEKEQAEFLLIQQFLTG